MQEQIPILDYRAGKDRRLRRCVLCGCTIALGLLVGLGYRLHTKRSYSTVSWYRDSIELKDGSLADTLYSAPNPQASATVWRAVARSSPEELFDGGEAFNKKFGQGLGGTIKVYSIWLSRSYRTRNGIEEPYVPLPTTSRAGSADQ